MAMQIIKGKKWLRENAHLIPGLATYTGKPCVYVRWVESVQACYIGRTNDLFTRYVFDKLIEVIYFEEYDDNDFTHVREAMLIYEFKKAGVPLANLELYPGRKLKRDSRASDYR